MTGQRFGRLVALARVPSMRRGITLWRCRCDCGRETVVRYLNLGRITRSCGCLRVEAAKVRERKKNHPTHGGVLSYYLRNAKTRGISWSLTPDQFTTLVTSPCHYCGCAPVERWLKGKMVMWSGVDRVDNTRGYEPGNVVPCCRHCNSAKGSRSVEEFNEWAHRVVHRIHMR